MDLIKSLEFLNPVEINDRIHIIGCGSVGSTIAENLARFGFTKFSLYDFDHVESRNIANQMFVNEQITDEKVYAVKDIITSINPEAETDIIVYPNGYINQRLNGYVFLAVDNIDLRRKIATDNKLNNRIKAMFDIRTRLLDAQGFAANWKDADDVNAFIETMNFSHEEANEQTEFSACHVAMSVCPTIRIIVAYQVANFINFIKGVTKIKKQIMINAFNFDAFAV